jgi:hypothetical protein
MGVAETPQVVKGGGSLTQKWVAKSPNAQIYLFVCFFYLTWGYFWNLLKYI